MLRIVDDLIALMPGVTTDDEAADRLAAFPREDQLRVGLLAKVRKPSPDTWTAFVKALRERRSLATLEGGNTASSRDVAIPAHICDFHRDDTSHCKLCGARVESVIA